MTCNHFAYFSKSKYFTLCSTLLSKLVSCGYIILVRKKQTSYYLL